MLAGAPLAKATAIQLDLGSPGTLSHDSSIVFNNLNGTPLAGQQLSLDFSFANSEFVRLFTVTTTFEVALSFQTNGSDLVGFLEGTGFLVDEQGNALHTAQDLGSASTSGGVVDVGLFPLFSGELNKPTDFFGVHFDLTFPIASSVGITQGTFRLYAYPGGLGPFGVGPGLPRDIVPETGSTLLFAIIALSALFVAVILRRYGAGRFCSSR